MNKAFLPRMALDCLRKNKRTYVPYFLTSMGTVLMFFSMCSLTYHPFTNGHQNLKSLMVVGMIITGIFSAIFLFYTNSFLIKRRKKEFGLFNILGMEKKHIGLLMLWESIIVGVGSIAAGILLGLLFNKLLTLLLFKMLSFDPDYSFTIVPSAIVATLVLFGAVHVLTLLVNLLQVRLSNPAELLRGGSVGEKEPKTNWVTAVLGVICLGLGYWLAVTIESPVEAINMFFIAVVLVIAGTYFLFISGSIALLKILRKNKNYYYTPRRFTTISGMIYRMRQNAAGLANICILSTAVLVMISTTVSMFIGTDDLMSTRFPNDVCVDVYYSEGDGESFTGIRDKAFEIAAENGRSVEDAAELNYYSFASTYEDGAFVPADSAYYMGSGVEVICMITEEGYHDLTGETVSLSDGETIVCTKKDVGGSVSVFGRDYKVVGRLDSFSEIGAFTSYMVSMNYMIVPGLSDLDETFSAVRDVYGEENVSGPVYEITFDTDGTKDEKYQMGMEMMTLQENQPDNARISVEARELNRDGFLETYGGLFFLGIFLGTLFLMATVLIIYYKQVIEGFDDKERFRIMQNVGMSKSEVRKTIHSQVLTVFFIPLVMAFIHIAVAFPMLTRILSLMNLTNTGLFAWCTIGTCAVFALIYAAVYALTARVYCNIVYSDTPSAKY